MTDDELEDAYTEHGKRESEKAGATPEGQLTDLASARNILGLQTDRVDLTSTNDPELDRALGLPRKRAAKLDKVPTGFDSLPGGKWDQGADHGTANDPADRKAGKRYREKLELGALVTVDGHGFGTERVGKQTANKCLYCQAEIRYQVDLPCEFAEPQNLEPRTVREQYKGMPFKLVEFGEPKNRGDGQRYRSIVNEVAVFETVKPRSTGGTPEFDPKRCRCIACTRTREGDVTRTKPKTVCDADECQKAYSRATSAAKRERERAEDRLAAKRFLIDHPDWTDRDVADEVGVRKVRVTEARNDLKTALGM
jgi:hypothetical protein